MDLRKKPMARENKQDQQQRLTQQLQQRQNNWKQNFMIHPISTSGVVQTLHDFESPCEQQQHQKPYPVKENRKINNNNSKGYSNRKNSDEVCHAFLIDASHVTNYDENNDKDDDDGCDDDDDSCRQSFYNYYGLTQGIKEEVGEDACSNKLFVTFDYGLCDSIEHQHQHHHQHQRQQLSDDGLKRNICESDYWKQSTIECDSNVDEECVSQTWTLCSPHAATAEAAQYPVHRMQHNIRDNEISFLSTLTEYDVDEETEEEEEDGTYILRGNNAFDRSKIKSFDTDCELLYGRDDEVHKWR